MRQAKLRIISIAFCFILLVSLDIVAKSKNTDEKRFQLGFGAMASTGNLLGLIESVRLYQAQIDGSDYNYPGLSSTQQKALKDLNGAMVRAMMVANILGAMEYGFQMRILWHVLMAEVDLVLLPFDGSYNGRLDFLLMPSIGVRVPFFIMPYFLVGAMMTFSFYPNQFATVENWRDRWAATDNFVFRPGLNFRLGLDLKFKGFSIGAYYQYSIKDFQEFGNWYNKLVDSGINTNTAAGMIFGEQSRFGAAMCWYLF